VIKSETNTMSKVQSINLEPWYIWTKFLNIKS
jgi:hypothetical protein